MAEDWEVRELPFFFVRLRLLFWDFGVSSACFSASVRVAIKIRASFVFENSELVDNLDQIESQKKGVPRTKK